MDGAVGEETKDCGVKGDMGTGEDGGEVTRKGVSTLFVGGR